MFRKALAVALIAGVAMPIAACNTVRGAGRDIESASDATSDAMHCRTKTVWRNHHRVKVCR